MTPIKSTLHTAGLALLAAGMAADAGAIDVHVNGRRVNFTGAEPAQVQGSVLVPLRGVLEQMGAEFVWDQPTKTITGSKGERRFELTIGSPSARVDGKLTPLAVPAQVIRGNTMVPLRFVSEALGADVKWSNRTQTVEISTDEFYAGASGGNTNPNPGTGIRPNPAGDDTGTTVNGGGSSSATAVEPVIQSFRHLAGGPVKAGDSIEAELDGTPGGKAVFDVVGVATNIPMKETQPGHYTGKIAVPKGLSVNNARAFARLQVGNRQSPVVQAGNPITVDAQPPQILNLTPANGSIVTRARPDIYAEFRSQGEGAIAPDTARLIVNGKDVTDQARVTPGFLIYTPAQDLNGATMVQLRIADRAGNVQNAVTAFNVKPTATGLSAVTTSAEEPLAPGEALTVTAKGEPGGTATLTLPGVAQDVPLAESSPGTYTGTYTVKSSDKAYDVPVRVKLTAGGRSSLLEATKPVSFTGGSLQRPFLIEPKPGEKLSGQITVVGRAEPNSTVRVTLKTSGKLFGVLPLDGSEIVQEVKVGGDGVFKSDPLPLPRPIGAKNLQYQVELVTTDPSGRTSEPITASYGAK